MGRRRVLFVQHGDLDSPGLLGEALLARGIPLDILRPDLGEPVPENLGNYSGLALGGGEQGAYETDKYPYLAAEMSLIRAAAREEKPVLGLCLGAQLMAAAWGGQVRPAGVWEIGFLPVDFDPVAELDAVWAGLPRRIAPAHWHGDVLSPPPGAVPLARSELTPCQAFRYGPHHYGFQFHLEMTPEIFEGMANDSREELRRRGYEVDELVQQARMHLPSLRPFAEAVFSRWADYL